MAGFAILPGRLKNELTSLLIDGAAPDGDLAPFADWIREFGISADESTAATDLLSSATAAAAVSGAFAAIIADNSAFPSRDLVTARTWLGLAGFTAEGCE